VIVEIRGLHIFGYHGVEEEEQRLGQLFLYDLEFQVGERGSTDRIEDAVDYREVAQCVREVSDRRFALLEALASAVADAVLERFPVEQVKVRVRKPQVTPAGLTVEYTAATVERGR
jgi:7,8-dihydroneopterin aldolase/epimerase/oxygenase